jgi:hypothetical protein
MPLAIAPVLYAKRRAWSARNVGSPSCSGRSGGRYASTGRPSVEAPSWTGPPAATAGPWFVSTTTTGELKSATAARTAAGSSVGAESPGTHEPRGANGRLVPAGWVIGGGGSRGRIVRSG